MASVGGSPDFMLTVWDWEREKIVLRSKAFSQDIYRVTFSPENPGQLTTSGTGHIRYTHDTSAPTYSDFGLHKQQNPKWRMLDLTLGS